MEYCLEREYIYSSYIYKMVFFPMKPGKIKQLTNCRHLVAETENISVHFSTASAAAATMYTCCTELVCVTYIYVYILA